MDLQNELFSSLLHVNGAMLLVREPEDGNAVWKRFHRSEESWKGHVPIWDEFRSDADMGIGFRVPVWMKRQKKELYLIQTGRGVVQARVADQDGPWRGLKLIERGQASWKEILWLFDHTCRSRKGEIFSHTRDGIFMLPMLLHNCRYYAEQDRTRYTEALIDMLEKAALGWKKEELSVISEEDCEPGSSVRRAMWTDTFKDLHYLRGVSFAENQVWRIIQERDLQESAAQRDGILLRFSLYEKKEEDPASSYYGAYDIKDRYFILDLAHEKLYPAAIDQMKDNKLSSLDNWISKEEVEVRTPQDPCTVAELYDMYMKSAEVHWLCEKVYMLLLLYEKQLDETLYLCTLEDRKELIRHVDY